MGASVLAGLLGSLGGAVLISGAIFLAFKLARFDIPRFPNLWKSAFFASALVVIVSTLGAELQAGAVGGLAILAIALLGVFVVYEYTLETPDGERMGRKAAAVALVAHSAFSIFSFLVILPLIVRALM